MSQVDSPSKHEGGQGHSSRNALKLVNGMDDLVSIIDREQEEADGPDGGHHEISAQRQERLFHRERIAKRQAMASNAGQAQHHFGEKDI